MSQDTFILSDILSVFTLIAAITAAVYSFRSFRLKSGIEVRGFFSRTSSIAAEDQYISEVTLENMKERAVVIFGIYLEVGHGCYIEIDNFEEKLAQAIRGYAAGSPPGIHPQRISLPKIGPLYE